MREVVTFDSTHTQELISDLSRDVLFLRNQLEAFENGVKFFNSMLGTMEERIEEVKK